MLFDAIVFVYNVLSQSCFIPTVLKHIVSSKWAQEKDHIVNYLQQLAYKTKHNDIRGAYYAKIQFFWEVGKETILTTEIPNTGWLVADMKSGAAKPDMLSSDPGE